MWCGDKEQNPGDHFRDLFIYQYVLIYINFTLFYVSHTNNCMHATCLLYIVLLTFDDYVVLKQLYISLCFFLLLRTIGTLCLKRTRIHYLLALGVRSPKIEVLAGQCSPWSPTPQEHVSLALLAFRGCSLSLAHSSFLCLFKSPSPPLLTSAVMIRAFSASCSLLDLFYRPS